MTISNEETIKQCLRNSYMHELQEKNKVAIPVNFFKDALGFTFAYDVKELVKTHPEFLQEIFNVDGFTTTVEYRPSKGKRKGDPKSKVIVSLTINPTKAL